MSGLAPMWAQRLFQIRRIGNKWPRGIPTKMPLLHGQLCGQSLVHFWEWN